VVAIGTGFAADDATPARSRPVDRFTGAWTALIGVALTETSEAPAWVGVVGIVPMGCSLELVSRAGSAGWKLAERATPVAYVAWSLWLVATGVALLV
jgi:hypothetical protein